VRVRLGAIGACGVVVLALTVLGATRVDPQPAPLVHLDDLGPRQVKSQSFVLSSPQEIQIEAIGAESADKTGKSSWMGAMWERNGKPIPPWTGNAWILDLQSRRVVWELSEATTTEGSHGLRTFKGNVHLPAGSYRAYYASFPDGEYWSEDGKKTAPDRKWHWFGNQPVQEFKLILRADGRELDASERDRLRGLTSPSTIVALRGASPQTFEQAGFAISKPTEVQIYAVGEAREDGEFDFAWIVNADTRAPVWRFTYRDSQPAGGAPKNRAVTTSQVLPAGRYAVFYATDDSHDPSEWNAQPPHDPEAWGVTLTVKDAAARAAVKTFDYELVPANATIVALTKVGNRASKKQGFTLTRAMDLRIYALGEGRGGRMFDYGWITSDESHKRVWTMEYDGTESSTPWSISKRAVTSCTMSQTTRIRPKNGMRRRHLTLGTGALPFSLRTRRSIDQRSHRMPRRTTPPCSLNSSGFETTSRSASRSRSIAIPTFASTPLVRAPAARWWTTVG
jgi:hypothetical protein